MAAGSTYTPIATTTLGSAVTSFTFTSIPQTYTDLILIASGSISASGPAFKVRVGSSNTIDTGNNYSMNRLIWYASGSPYPVESPNISYYSLDGSSYSSSAQNIAISNIMNYSNTTTYKTMLNRSGYASDQAEMSVALWRSTNAINTIQVLVDSQSINAGTTFTLYGIASA